LPEGLTDKQKQFVEKKFNPDNLEDLSDDGLKKFSSDALNEYKDMAEIFGNESKGSDDNSGTGSDGLSGDTKATDEEIVNHIFKS
jgi:hypothetical protein